MQRDDRRNGKRRTSILGFLLLRSCEAKPLFNASVTNCHKQISSAGTRILILENRTAAKWFRRATKIMVPARSQK
jgi:hypothetical protein